MNSPGYDEMPGALPTAWEPTPEFIYTTNIAWLMRRAGVDSYKALHQWSVRQRETFWALVIERLGIQFQRPFSRVLDLSHGVETPRWLADAQLNIVESCFAGPADSPAIVYQVEGGELAVMKVAELAELTGQVAASLKRRGFKPGDALAIVMPMTAESVAIYLGIIKAGCVVVGIADSFRPKEIALRLRLSQAVAVFTQDVVVRGGKTLPLYAKLIEAAAPTIIVLPAQAHLDTATEPPSPPSPREERAGRGVDQKPTRDDRITPAHEPGEIPRESVHVAGGQMVLPLPGGEGRGEGGRPTEISPPWFMGAMRVIIPGRSLPGPPQPKLSIPLRTGDCEWADFLQTNDRSATVIREPSDPINILFSSGTTGEPKAIPWTQTTPIKCAMDAHFHQNIQPGDVLVWPTNLGWMMGPWLVFASLLNRATIGLYYGAPTGREFGCFVQKAGTTMLGVVPSLVKTWRGTGCMENLDWNSIKVLSSTGECSNAEDMRWLMSRAGGKPVIEYCGGTEIGGGYITGTVTQPCLPGAFNTPALGLDFVIVDEQGKPADTGELFLIPPSIGLSTTLLNQNHHEVYFAGTPKGPLGETLRRHGDQMEKLGDGHWRGLGRADDTMNLGGIKVSSAEIEAVLQSVPGVKEVAAIGVSPADGPSQLVIYAVSSSDRPLGKDELMAAMQSAIKRDLNPLFKIHDLILIEALPRTASNKVIRRALRDK